MLWRYFLKQYSLESTEDHRICRRIAKKITTEPLSPRCNSFHGIIPIVSKFWISKSKWNSRKESNSVLPFFKKILVKILLMSKQGIERYCTKTQTHSKPEDTPRINRRRGFRRICKRAVLHAYKSQRQLGIVTSFVIIQLTASSQSASAYRAQIRCSNELKHFRAWHE